MPPPEFYRRQIVPLIRLFFAVLALQMFGARPAEGYSLNGYRWPDGTQIVIHLGLNHTPSSFPDGTGSWNDSAADALSIWNQYVNRAQFVQAGAVNPMPQDGSNSASFSNTVYGDSWGTGVLAITLRIGSSGSNFTETDVIFNNKLKWSSYRGPQIGSGPNGTYDFHRVALHEFGHVLGLDHPDQYGQSVEAVMNSIISNLDHLSDDDIAGARSLYGLRITSASYSQAVGSGNLFSYQITADNNPTSFSATGLPPGIQLDPSTGLISGICTTSGTFTINLVVQGTLGTATGSFQLTVYAAALTSSLFPTSVLTGDPFTYRITAGNNPTSFSVVGQLPEGLNLDPATGVISGIPITAGTYDISVKANGPRSEAAGIVRITVMPPTITSSLYQSSFDIGSSFTYQIVANNHPTSFDAIGLPSGLELDPVTGTISGVLTLSGDFPITIVAHSDRANASATLRINVVSLPVPTKPLASFTSLSPRQILADPIRPKLYVLEYGRLSVIDTRSLAITHALTLAKSVGEISLSADGSKLWLTFDEYNGDYKAIGRLDLETLTFLPDLPLGTTVAFAREGLNNRLYVATRTGSVLQVDAVTGATQVELAASLTAPPQYSAGFPTYLEISPDRAWLYLAVHYSGAVAKVDVSTAAPTVVATTSLIGSVGRLQLSKTGALLGNEIGATFNGGTYRIMTQPFGNPVPNYKAYGGAFAYTSNDALAFVASPATSTIYGFDSATNQLRQTIGLDRYAYASQMAVDNTDTYLFVQIANGPGAVRVYKTPLAKPVPGGPAKTLLNVATRLRCQTGDDVLIGGFIVTGTDPKKVILRATGPSLPVQDKLADPVIELHAADGSLVAANDNWNADRADVIAAGIPPLDEHESAIVVTLQPGAYTGVLRGRGESSGVALVELYDLSPESNSQIANISTRGKVETADNVMIGGFIIGGDQPTKVIVRAIGPSLSNGGVAAPLLDTMLELHDGNGALIASNDDWQSDQAQEIIDTTVAPTDSRESAIVRTLQPGNYTAIVRGKNETSGVALVEVFNLDN